MKHLQTIYIGNRKAIMITDTCSIEIDHIGASTTGTWYAIERAYTERNMEVAMDTKTIAVRMESMADAIEFAKEYIQSNNH